MTPARIPSSPRTTSPRARRVPGNSIRKSRPRRARAARTARARPEILEGFSAAIPSYSSVLRRIATSGSTISQIHTHKIRGADILLVAESDPDLSLAVRGKPTGSRRVLVRSTSRYPPPAIRSSFVFAATVGAAAPRLSYVREERCTCSTPSTSPTTASIPTRRKTSASSDHGRLKRRVGMPRKSGEDRRASPPRGHFVASRVPKNVSKSITVD